MNLLKNKLFLLALIAVLTLSMGAFVVACSSGDDDDDDNDDNDDNDDDTWTDDDDADDDDNDTGGDDDDTGDDDDDDDDDTGGDYTCDSVADGMINTCTTTLLDLEGVQQDVAGLTAWCEASEEFMAAKLASPFWNCVGDYVFVDFCDEAAIDACLDPGDPGSGCGSAVNGVYACGVVWVFEGTDFFIPEMDMQEACGSLDWTWDCYGDCVGSVTCSDPPTQPEANAMIACLNACETK